MDVMDPKAVVGTNSWGTALYEKLLRGSVVDEQTIRESAETARREGLLCFDFAQDYGFGKAQKMMGSFGVDGFFISAKFTPFCRYKAGQVRQSLQKDLADFHSDHVDIYWLHLPNSIDQNLSEMISLYREGKIHHIGVSNFNLEECKKAKAILDRAGLPLYGVQNHYSLINRAWETDGLVAWCRENKVQFWAWAVLEEGMLADPRIKTGKSIMKALFDHKKRKLSPLYAVMSNIGKQHGLTIPQVAISYCSSKGIIPICGCRRPQQVRELRQAVDTILTVDELRRLEKMADLISVHILGSDLFRFAVRK